MYDPGYTLRLVSSARTNRGRVRQNNEDSIYLWARDHTAMAIVADGMGGAAAGEEASRLAIEIIQASLSNGKQKTPEDYLDVEISALANKLRDAVVKANSRIVERASQVPEFKGMGTTLTMALGLYNSFVLAHVGDSRAYLVNGHTGDILQLTSDHSFVQALVDAGHITAAEAEEHPMKNVLYRALGQGDDIDVDVHQDLRLHVGDRLVMCSDGLTLHVKPAEIADIVVQESDPNQCSERLINLANQRGGRDNISVITIYVEPGEEESSLSDTEADESFGDETTVLMINRSQILANLSEEARSNFVEVSYSENEGEGKDSLDPTS